MHRFDWTAEIATLACPSLFYWGSADRQMAPKLRRSREQLFLQHVDFVEIAGPDHAACNSSEVLAHHVVPMVRRWLHERARDT